MSSFGVFPVVTVIEFNAASISDGVPLKYIVSTSVKSFSKAKPTLLRPVVVPKEKVAPLLPLIAKTTL